MKTQNHVLDTKIDSDMINSLAEKAYNILCRYRSLDRMEFVNLIKSEYGINAYVYKLLVTNEKGVDQINKLILKRFGILYKDRFIYLKGPKCWVEKT